MEKGLRRSEIRGKKSGDRLSIAAFLKHPRIGRTSILKNDDTWLRASVFGQVT